MCTFCEKLKKRDDKTDDNVEESASLRNRKDSSKDEDDEKAEAIKRDWHTIAAVMDRIMAIIFIIHAVVTLYLFLPR